MSNYQLTILSAVFCLLIAIHSHSQVWISDQGNGTYKNPVLHADYSDPDAIRVGNDFYMIASSFDAVPGLPILHSKDLVNWSLIGHALPRQLPLEHFSKTQHGNGVWAPAIRYHQNEFYIYYPDPDFGIYLIKSKNILGPWSEPVLVEAGKGLIDPCPLWDDDGNVYLVHAYAGSRAGVKSILVIKRLNAAGDRVTDAGKLVYDGHELDPTIEGPKLHKRNGYYYIFAPAGGVSTGWQLVLRSKNIYGPYERKVVMEQGKTIVNGPHQGAWVDAPDGSDWFLHFQDKDVYGRVVHLQPMKWVNDWPVIGEDKDGDGKGEPVMTYKKPVVTKQKTAPPESDEFTEPTLGLQWQWQANPMATWSFLNPTKGSLRLYAIKQPEDAVSLWQVPNVLLQKFPAEKFTTTVKLTFTPNGKLENEKTGLVIMGRSYAALGLVRKADGIYIVYSTCVNADKGMPETEKIIGKFDGRDFYVRVTVTTGRQCVFSYSTDNKKFISIPESFQAREGVWIGAKMGLYCTGRQTTNDAGYADVDWFRVEP